eukprot:3223439-Rhodomonas_salina.1
MECMLPECNFDWLDCAALFESAGSDAMLPCDRASCFVYLEREALFCNAAACLHAGCDWSDANPQVSPHDSPQRCAPLSLSLSPLSLSALPTRALRCCESCLATRWPA